MTDLRGLRVMSLMTVLRMGVVEEALLDPTCRYVAALRVHGRGLRRYLVPRRHVKHIGRGAIIVAGSDLAPAALRLDDADRLINRRRLGRVVAVGERGDVVGRVRNVVVDPASLNVHGYVVASAAGGGARSRRAPARLVDVLHTLGASGEYLVLSDAAMALLTAGPRRPSRPRAGLFGASAGARTEGAEAAFG